MRLARLDLATRQWSWVSDGLNWDVDELSVHRDTGTIAFLINDDGMSRLLRGRTFSGSYAVSTALHIRYPRIGQGESTSVLHSTRIRLSDDVDPQAANHYLFDGGSVPLEREDVTLQVKQPAGEPKSETRTFWHTPLGPVVLTSHFPQDAP